MRRAIEGLVRTWRGAAVKVPEPDEAEDIAEAKGQRDQEEQVEQSRERLLHQHKQKVARARQALSEAKEEAEQTTRQRIAVSEDLSDMLRDTLMKLKHLEPPREE